MEIINSLSINWNQNADTQPPAPATSCCDLYSWGARLFEDWTYTLLVSASVLAVAGIFIAVISGSPFLAVSFAVLALATFYAAKLIKDLGDLKEAIEKLEIQNKTFDESNKGLKKSLEVADTINTSLGQKLSGYEQENVQFKQSNETLVAQIAVQKQSSEALMERLHALAVTFGTGNEEGKRVVSQMITAQKEENKKSKLVIEEAARTFAAKFQELTQLLADWQKPGATADTLAILIKVQKEVSEGTERLHNLLGQIEARQENLSALREQVSTMKTEVSKFSEQNVLLNQTVNNIQTAFNNSPTRNGQSFFSPVKTGKALHFNPNDSIV